MHVLCTNHIVLRIATIRPCNKQVVMPKTIETIKRERLIGYHYITHYALIMHEGAYNISVSTHSSSNVYVYYVCKFGY